MIWRVLIVMLCFAALNGAMAAQDATPLTAWRGEFMRRGQGATVISARLVGFPKLYRGNEIGTQVSVYIINQQTRARYVFFPQKNDATQIDVWKLPAGDYLIDNVMVDYLGKKRNWRRQITKKFSIVEHTLSDLGTWQISPSGTTDLEVKFQVLDRELPEELMGENSSFGALINGFTGKVLQALGGKDLYKQSGKNFGKRDEMRATITHTRQISMVYRLDLKRYGRYNRNFVKVLATHDQDLRTCYSDRLNDDADLAGSVRFQFQVSRSSGVMQNFKIVGGTLRDPKLIQCMYYQLASIQFPVRAPIVGNIDFQFRVYD